MKLYAVVLLFVLALVAGGCSKRESEEKLPAGFHKIVAEEVIMVSSYTYVRGKEGDKEIWMAFTKREVKKGDVLYYNEAGAMEMKDFTSPELKRMFPSIWFVSEISDRAPAAQPAASGAAQQPAMGAQQPQKPQLSKEDIKVDKAAGGITIAELLSKSASFDKKTVKIQGKVTKINTGIMGKNWLHLQDGSAAGDAFDLTVTTEDVANVGDIVTVEGKVALNQDFGYGYSYKVLVEEAKIKK